MPVNEPALTARRLELLSRLRTITADRLARAWAGLDNYTDPDPFTAVAQPIVTAAQQQSAGIQHAYLEALVGPLPFDLPTILAKASIDVTQPFISFANALATGLDVPAAIDAGSARAQAVGESGVQWAARAANTAADRRVTGWQRVPDPGACDWCVLVAGQTYHTADTASFGHLRCFCDVQPLI